MAGFYAYFDESPELLDMGVAAMCLPHCSVTVVRWRLLGENWFETILRIPTCSQGDLELNCNLELNWLSSVSKGVWHFHIIDL